jgi:4-hydroxy-tetrahydrodipicolinate synthase
MKLQGVISAVATPFTDGGGEIDEPALRRLIDRTLDDGADGLIACASTGEFATMTAREREAVAQITVEQAGGRVPVVVNTGAMSTAEAIRLSRDAERRGADGVMPVASYYDPLRLDETFEYHRAIAAAIDIPIVAYNHPDSTGVDLPAAFIARLGREIPNVEYVKDSSASFLHLAQLTQRHRDDVHVLSGVDAFLLPALQIGAEGGVLGTANYLARPLSALLKEWRDGDHSAAIARWSVILPALLATLDGDRYSFVAAVKAASRLTGLDLGTPRLPSRALSAEEESDFAQALARIPEMAERMTGQSADGVLTPR